MTDNLQRNQESYQHPKSGLCVFAIVSWGSTATHWLAEVLDSHPEVRCFHNLSGSMAHTGGVARIDGVRYAQVLREQSLGYRAVGDIHGFGRRAIPEVQQALGDRFRCVVVVRDPERRFRSMIGLYRGPRGALFMQRRVSELEYIKAVGREAGLDFADDDWDSWLVAHAANMLNEILEEQLLGPVIRMEDVVSSAGALAALVSTLTAGKVQAEQSWAERELGRAPVGPHWLGDELAEWERDVAKAIVKPAAWDAYRSLGYARTLGSA